MAFLTEADIYVSLALIRPDLRWLSPEFLVHWLNSPLGQAHCRRDTLGKGHSQGNLNLKLLRGFTLPIPPLREQRRILVELEEYRTQVDALKSLQSKSAAELKALMPSVLDKAFRGEL
jgi:type I restriction enzyme S subunit